MIALERDDRAMWRRIKSALIAEQPPITHAGAVGQVWRGGGPRQAMLARALAGVEVVAIDEALGRAAGELLSKSRSHDVIDAAVVLLAADGDHIVTSDVSDLARLARAARRQVAIVKA